MAVHKRDMAINELFIKPIRGLYLDHAITIDEFKERNVSLMKNRWIDTQHGSTGEKIYELYDPEQEGELIKESFQEWLCDNRNEITECIGIALRNHEKSYAEWFRYVDSRSGPDELALYGLSRKYGVQTAIFNKSYVWTTLADHVSRSDEEILSLCSVNLLFLDETTYGKIRKIRAPNPPDTEQKTQSTGKTRQKSSKKTYQDTTRNRKSNKAEQKPKPAPVRGKRTRTLSESRQVTFGIQAPPAVNRSVRRNRQTIDYLTLNDGLEDDEVSSPKRKKRTTYRPGSGPSATRQSASKHTVSHESKSALKSKTTGTLPAIPASTFTVSSIIVPDHALTGVLDEQKLPDLVLEHDDPNTSQATGAISTEEEMDAVAALLSLGEIRDDTLEDDDNAELMPIGGRNVAVDAAPEPIRLDQVSVDKAIAGLIQDDQDRDTITGESKEHKTENQPSPAEPVEPDEARLTMEKDDKPEPPVKGTLKTKTYALKKKVETKRRSFKCSECDVMKTSIKDLNIHHEECHNPQICGVCGKLFKLASSLARHMYAHNIPKYKCDQCDHMCQFESELNTHKIVHRKNPSHQCMKANCGKWFRRKWDLTLHLQKHDGV